MKRVSWKYLLFSISMIFHAAILVLPLELPNFSLDNLVQNKPTFKIAQLRTVGIKDSKTRDLKSIPAKKNISLADLSANNEAAPKIQPFKKPIIKKLKPALENLKISKRNLKNYLSSEQRQFSSKQILNSFEHTDINVQFELPKGVKEDELNKRELVFYAFKRRTVAAYINSFYSQYNKFEKKNPHLKFPLTEKPQKMTGRIIYDKDGDILKIETLRWSKVTKLQNFFMEMLKEMESLPNPPADFTRGEDFSMYFTLLINQ